MVLIDWVKCIPTAIFCSVQRFADWLVQVMLYIPRQIFALIVAGFVDFFGAIPVFSFLSDIQGYLDSASSFLGYLFDITHASTGFAIMLTAYLARFILRRIPGIG